MVVDSHSKCNFNFEVLVKGFDWLFFQSKKMFPILVCVPVGEWQGVVEQLQQIPT